MLKVIVPLTPLVLQHTHKVFLSNGHGFFVHAHPVLFVVAPEDWQDNIKKSAPGKKMRSTDKNTGDLAIKPSATPVKDPSAKMQTAEAYGVSGNKVSDSLLDAVNKVTHKG